MVCSGRMDRSCVRRSEENSGAMPTVALRVRLHVPHEETAILNTVRRACFAAVKHQTASLKFGHYYFNDCFVGRMPSAAVNPSTFCLGEEDVRHTLSR